MRYLTKLNNMLYLLRLLLIHEINNIMKKIIKTISRLGILALVAGFTFQGISVEAAGSFNGRPEDCNTTSVINDTTLEGLTQPCWSGRNITVRPGEEFTIKVYARNTGSSAISNVALTMTDVRGATITGGQTRTFSGRISSGAGEVVDNVSISFTGSTDLKIELVGSELEKYVNGVSTGKQSLGTAVYGSGLTVYSSMPADLGQWVTAKARYRAVAVNGGGNNDNDATLQVSTDRVQITNENSGNVEFTGSYSTNRSSAQVHFNYRKIGSSTNSTTKQTKNGSASSFTATVNGLSTGNYEFQACAAVTGNSDCAAWKSFNINRNDDPVDTSNELRVNTLSPVINNERNGNVTFQGDYNRNNNRTAQTYFEYERDSGSLRTVNGNTYTDTSRSFDRYVTGLSEGSYRYRACVNNGDVVCGSWRSFNLEKEDDYVPPVESNTRPTVTTLSAIQRGSNSITADGWFNIQSCGGSTWFEYGTNQSMVNRTSQINRNSYNNGSMAQVINGLSQNTVYYYRAVAENCKGTTYGSTFSATTTGGTVIVQPPKGGTTTTITKVVKNIGAGNKYVRLMIDNGQDSVMKGDNLIYDVYWENVTKQVINDLVLEVSFPEGLEILSSDQGQLDRTANKVYLNISKLEALEKDDMTIRAQVVGTKLLQDNDAITARAILAFENPTVEAAYENAIAYDSDTYFVRQAAVGAGLFGGTFLPATLAGWIFLILLLIIILAIIRYAIRREEKHYHYHGNVKKNHEEVLSQDEDDYIPYRPTPKE